MKQVQRVADHVRVDAEQRRVFPAQHRRVVLVPDAPSRSATVASRSCAGVAFGWSYIQCQTAMSTSATPAISQVIQKSLSTRRRSGSASGLPRPSSSRSRAWKTKAMRLGEGGVGHAGEQRVVDVVEREHLLHVVAQLVDGDVVALVVHAVLLDARAQVGEVAAAGGLHARGRRRATGSTLMCSARYVGALRREARARCRMRGMSFAKASARRVAFARQLASSSLSAMAPRGRKPLYQRSCGSSLRPRRCSISAAPPCGTSGEVEHLRRAAPSPAPRASRAPIVEGASDGGGRHRRERVGLASAPRKLAQQPRVAHVGLGRRRRRRPGVFGASASSSSAGVARDGVGERVPVDAAGCRSRPRGWSG